MRAVLSVERVKLCLVLNWIHTDILSEVLKQMYGCSGLVQLHDLTNVTKAGMSYEASDHPPSNARIMCCDCLCYPGPMPSVRVLKGGLETPRSRLAVVTRAGDQAVQTRRGRASPHYCSNGS